jgi:hypothetical protein
LVTRQDASGWDTARQSGRSEDGRRDYDRLGGRNDGCGDSSRGNAGRRGDSSPSRGDDRLGGRNDGRGDSSRGNAGRRGYDQNGLPLVTSQISMTVDGRAFPVNNKLRVVVDGKVVPVEQNLTIHTQ